MKRTAGPEDVQAVFNSAQTNATMRGIRKCGLLPRCRMFAVLSKALQAAQQKMGYKPGHLIFYFSDFPFFFNFPFSLFFPIFLFSQFFFFSGASFIFILNHSIIYNDNICNDSIYNNNVYNDSLNDGG